MSDGDNVGPRATPWDYDKVDMHREAERRLIAQAEAEEIMTLLTDGQRLVVDLARKGYTHAEIAAQLGVGRTAVTMHLKRAAERLRDLGHFEE